MTRRLSLVRHAKSSWDDARLADHDRPLNARGKRDAPEMGRRLAARGVHPSLLLTSTAKRARATAEIIAEALDYPPESLQAERDLYLASPATILRVVAFEGGDAQHVMVFGHNPGITDLASRLTGMHIDNVPTAGIVTIDLDIDDWSQAEGARGTLVSFDYPKKASPE